MEIIAEAANYSASSQLTTMKPFSQWNSAEVLAHNERILQQRTKKSAPIGLIAESIQKEQLKKTQRLDRRPILEAEIQQQIDDFLKTQSHRCWWDRKRMDQKTSSRIGVPDFVGTITAAPGSIGIPFGIEVKRPGQKPTPEQLGELAWMQKAGAKTAVVFSCDEAKDFLLGLVEKS